MIQELRTQLSSGGSEYIKLNEKYLQAELDLSRIKVEIEKTRQSNIELNLYTNIANEKKEELQEVQRGLKIKMREIQLSRDKALTKSSSLEKEMNRILLLQINSNEEEENNNNNNNSSNNNNHRNSNRWRNHTCQELKRRDQVIHSLKIQNAELSIQAEKDRRENEANQTRKQNLERLMKKERMTTKTEFETLQMELSDATGKLKAEHLQKMEAMSARCAVEGKLISLEGLLKTSKGELQLFREEDKRKSQESTEIRIHLQTKINCLNATLQKETSKLIEEKESLILEKDEIVNAKDGDLNSIQSKIHQLELSTKEFMKSNQFLRSEIQAITNNYTNEKLESNSKFKHKSRKSTKIN